MGKSTIFILAVVLIGFALEVIVGQNTFEKISKVVAIIGAVIFIVVLIWAVGKL